MSTTQRALATAGDRVLLADLDGRQRTGAEIADRVARLAAILAGRGDTTGRVGLWHRNSIAAVEAALAVEWLGATRVPVDPNATAAEAQAIWAAVGVDVVVADAAAARELARDVVISDDDSTPTDPPIPPVADVDPERICLLYPRALQADGLIRVRSAMVVQKYADHDGWCTLTDLGQLEGGYLHLSGRADRMINTGYHIFPQEVELATRAVPGVAEVLVRGEPDAQRGQRVVAYLVATSDTRVIDLIKIVDDHLRGTLAPYKVPRQYHVVPQLPPMPESSP